MTSKLSKSELPEKRWSVAQLGARMHYAVPRILNGVDRLQMLHTDICNRKGVGRLASFVSKFMNNDGLTRLASRNPIDIPSAKIKCYDRFGIEYASRRRQAQKEEDLVSSFIWSGQKFCELIIPNVENAGGLYCFNSAGLELLEHCQKIGIPGVIEQTIAPKLTEKTLLLDEMAQFPDWHLSSAYDNKPFQTLADRESEEWDKATTVVCGSEFVRDEIISCGGPGHKCVVVPYGAKLESVIGRGTNEIAPASGPLRVLTVGAVELRKGSQYVLNVAKALHKSAEFRMVGSVSVPKRKAAELSQAVDLTGVVPRSTVSRHFEWADIFFLPSVCEGSATVTYEALNAGLPVVCTPNTGSVIEDGISGYLVPHGNTEIMIERIAMLARDRELLRSLSGGAYDRAKYCTVEAYGDRLLQCLKMSERWNQEGAPS